MTEEVKRRRGRPPKVVPISDEVAESSIEPIESEYRSMAKVDMWTTKGRIRPGETEMITEEEAALFGDKLAKV